ncbi:MAG: GDSL-type esterase/lipase family protein [Acetobacteraceae bacterium]|nr:GDSL-type esterase/lipase family protein [Acetobacteraceae bacterium]
MFRIQVAAALVVAFMTIAAAPSSAQRWVTSWSGSAQGPYPSGNESAQPGLQFAFPDGHIHDQTFRLIVRPSTWGRRARLRFSNAFGTEPLTVDEAFVGLQMSGAAVAPGSNRPLTFKSKKAVVIPAGADAWSDPMTLPFVGAAGSPELLGRKLAVSFHVAGDVRHATWHAKAMQTSYVMAAGAGALGELEDESPFPNSTTSWYFLDAIDMQAGPELSAVVCLGDSITDGSNSTLNGDDRWPDVLARRLLAAGTPMAVVNAGIGGNQVVGPAEYAPETPVPGGPSALSRLDRDVLALSGVSHVIWLEGINDFSANGKASFEQVRDGMKQGVARLRAKFKGVKVIGATLTSALGSTVTGHGTPDQDAQRRQLNEWIRHSGGTFDAVADFDRATVDRTTGKLRPEFVPNSTVGGPGDGLHPNRAGYAAMADAVDLGALHAPFVPKPKPKPRPENDESAE